MEVAAGLETDLTKSTFSQVVFTDVPHSYSPSDTVTCRYILNEALKASPRDWVGIFKVGWSSIKEYHTFVWAASCPDEEGQLRREAVFKEYYLPKDEVEFYQFCYIDSTGQVKGASTPFCFRNAAELSMESNANYDALVVTTQEQVEQNLREKDELQERLRLMTAENETLRRALQQEQRDELKEAERARLLQEMDQRKEENTVLKRALQLQQEEMSRLQLEMVTQQMKQVEMEHEKEQKTQTESMGSSSSSDEKYQRAVLKINQLKEERENLKRHSAAQSEEILQLKAKLSEGEQELTKTKDNMQLLQVDLMRSDKEKDRMTAKLQRLESLNQDMNVMQRENTELSRRLSEQDFLRNALPNNSMVQCETLGRQLHDAQVKLDVKTQELHYAKRQVDVLTQELQEVKQQLDHMAITCDMEQQNGSKFEMRVNEMNEILAETQLSSERKEQELELIKQEKEALIRENEELKSDIEKLRKVFANQGTDISASPMDAANRQPPLIELGGETATGCDPPSGFGSELTSEREHLYESIESIGERQDEEDLLVCHHCQEKFPGITLEELAQHEQTHRVCPFCTMICDGMEQTVFEDHVYGHGL